VSDSARSAASPYVPAAIDAPPTVVAVDWPQQIAVVAATALVLQTVFAGQLIAVDAWTHTAIATLSWGHRALVDIRLFASLAPYYGAALVGLGIHVARRRGASWTEIAYVAGGLGLGLVLAHGMKLVCWRARPAFQIGGMQLDSFPSGHTASLAFCLAAALRLLALRSRRDDRWWYATAAVGTILTAAVAFARVYLERHWATDVSASLLMAIAFWGSASSARVPRVWLALTLGLGLLTLGGVHTMLPSPPSTHRGRPMPCRGDATGRDVRRAPRASSASRP
jgi:membrane-associated phospholipid phosphatase